MFTGLIREKAKVLSYKDNKLTIKATHKPKIGDSISINGACLSVVSVENETFSVELTNETRKNLATENLKDLVHIEPAMKLDDRLDGHLVQGHIDAIGKITKIQKDENGTDFFIKIDKNLIKFVVPKGSIAVDGVSLTVNEVYEDSFKLTIIPLTLKDTLFGSYKIGARVNIETDMIARYLYHLTHSSKSSLTWEEVDKITALF